jgi:hypothetical protein
MRQALSTITLIVFGFILCSMSQCKEDKTPGPVTTVQGYIKDAITGETHAGMVLQVVKKYSTLANIDNGPSYSDYDTVVTHADGFYKLTFTPMGTGDFSLRLVSGPINYIQTDYGKSDLTLGTTNTVNMQVIKLINVSLHVKNTTDHGRQNFTLQNYLVKNNVSSLSGSYDLYKALVDTTFKIQLPHLSQNDFVSIYFTGYNKSGPGVGLRADTTTLKRTILTGKNDTLINIINP